jgi:hypothetical protein
MPISITGSGLINGLELPTDSIQPGLVHIATESFSAISSVSLNNCFSSTYQNYKIVISCIGSTSANVFVRWRTGGTDNSTASSYQVQLMTAINTSVAAARGDTNQGEIGAIRTAAYNGFSYDIFNVFESQKTMLIGSCADEGATGFIHRDYGILHNQTVSYDGFSFYPNAGTITGTIRVYGYRNGI